MALQGEDPTKGLFATGTGSVEVKLTRGHSPAVQKWKSTYDMTQTLMQWIGRARTDGYFHVAVRLQDILVYVVKLSAGKQLLYVKRLLNKSHWGIPRAEDPAVLEKINKEWEDATCTSALLAKLHAQEEGGAPSDVTGTPPSGGPGAGKQLQADMCACCRKVTVPPHKAKDCPEACPTCSTEKFFPNKKNCACSKKGKAQLGQEK